MAQRQSVILADVPAVPDDAETLPGAHDEVVRAKGRERWRFRPDGTLTYYIRYEDDAGNIAAAYDGRR